MRNVCLRHCLMGFILRVVVMWYLDRLLDIKEWERLTLIEVIEPFDTMGVNFS